MRLHPGADEEPARIAAARSGDRASQEWIVRKWEGPVYRFARRMLGNDEDALDAAQDSLVKALRKLDQYDDARAFSTWMFGIVRNTCIDEYRRRQRRAWDEPGDLVDGSPSPLHLVTRAERAAHLETALEQLAPLYREVLVLYHFEHLKYVEIAEVLDIPIGTVMNRIFRARQKLRALYEASGGEAPPEGSEP